MTACSNCGSTRTHSDRVGCCTGCRRLFVGIRAFDRHRSWTTGQGRCLDPATVTTANGAPIFDADDNGHGTPAYRLSRTDAERHRLAARLDTINHPGVALEAHPETGGVTQVLDHLPGRIRGRTRYGFWPFGGVESRATAGCPGWGRRHVHRER